MSAVLVTGGSGFIGSHTIVQLLAAGHQVRTTVRNLARDRDVREFVRAGGGDPGDRLTVVAADLERDAGWPEAVDGIDYVLHIASPFPSTVPEGRGRSDRPRPRRRAARAACGTRCGRQAGSDDVVVRRRRLRPSQSKARRSTKRIGPTSTAAASRRT